MRRAFAKCVGVATSRDVHRCAFAIIAIAALACNRYEYVPQHCPSPPGRSAIAWRHVAGAPDVARVTVTLMDSLRPITDARVQLRPDSGTAVLRFQGAPYVRSGIAPGRYTLDVMRIGYSRVSREVEVRADSGLEAVAVMSPQVMMLDGCGHVYLKTKKPWWKWW